MPSRKKLGKPRSRTALEVRLIRANGASTLEEAIEQTAQHLLENYTIPVRLEPLAHKLNARITVLPADWTLGETHRLSDRNEIKIRAEDQGPQRQRFTLAHEYAHIIIDSLGRRRVPTSPALEQLCDKIAAAILMPHRELRGFISQETPREILKIADAFDVSLQAAAIRFATITGCSVFRVSRRGSEKQKSLPFARDREGQVSVTRLAGPLRLTAEIKRTILDGVRLYHDVRGASVREWLITSTTARNGDRLVLLKPRH